MGSVAPAALAKLPCDRDILGKPIEINALWLNALEVMAAFARQLGANSDHYQRLAQFGGDVCATGLELLPRSGSVLYTSLLFLLSEDFQVPGEHLFLTRQLL